MGGTFNPIHYGHLVTAAEALHQFKLDQIIFMPSGRPPHKEAQEVAPPEDRYLMTVIATASNLSFSVSRLEIDKQAPSYTLETLTELRKKYAKETEIFFITGADAVLDILTWKQPSKIFELSRFIAATRPAYSMERLTELSGFRVAKSSEEEADIYLMEIPALAISSSDIRARLRDGRPVRYLVPDEVLDYITESHLYAKEGN